MLLLLAAFLLPGLAICGSVPEIVVVTVATEDTDGLRRLLKSAETYDIKVHVFGMGREWKGGDTRTSQGGGQKIRILSEELKPYKDRDDVIILFVDAYDVVFTAGTLTILDRFQTHFKDKRILFGAEPFCWPDESLAPEYPVVEFGKRFLNSGLFLGYAKELYKMITVKEVADDDDDQLYYTMIYLDPKLRKELKIGLDTMSRIFQNLNGVTDDVELQFDDNGDALAYNAAYNTHPAVLHGNGPSKKHLNYLANYVSGRWSSVSGCSFCGKKPHIDITATDPADFPLVALSIFIAKPIPFIEEMLEAVARLNYPKKKLVLYIYNSQRFSIKTVMDFLTKYGSQYYSKKVINGVSEIGEREARQEALAFASRFDAEFLFSLDGDGMLTNENTLQILIESSINYDLGIVAPLLGQPNKMFTNFWGAVAPNGYYERSEDYLAIVQRKRIGIWNVPFIATALLINKEKMKEMKTPFFYDKNLDVDMSFCKWARDNGHFMYVDNEEYFGFLIVSDDFNDIVHKGKLHPEMWEIFENRELWEARYLHPDYSKLLEEGQEIEQACPDVYDYPLVSERFSKEMIEEMEHYGKWSDGSNKVGETAGIRIDFERQWLFFLDEYVRPLQEKVFTGYYHRPVEANMMFVVRYRPDEQASLRPHHDASTFSVDIALNKKGVDYEGGGVRYTRYNCTVAADQVGYAMMFPGRLTHLHEGLPTTKGTRYILVSFVNP
ncbi:oxidoreductase, 2OG-Fe(II) oxygenase family protein [Ancylostoma caninum]|uniref:procollagen-lysine 5-dioxygenase n=1 Tax=Ancylostoma caninum TaxID=29170 RepID=A0A368FFM6_ANCCA|nr:oxidoreductase, 2OG-Fe(II) oxygenase family protein [Ancylostoma caninum]